jgi:hypothetical protein
MTDVEARAMTCRLFQRAVEKAVRAWLDSHAAEVLAAIRAAAERRETCIFRDENDAET